MIELNDMDAIELHRLVENNPALLHPELFQVAVMLLWSMNQGAVLVNE